MLEMKQMQKAIDSFLALAELVLELLPKRNLKPLRFKPLALGSFS